MWVEVGEPWPEDPTVWQVQSRCERIKAEARAPCQGKRSGRSGYSRSIDVLSPVVAHGALYFSSQLVSRQK